MGVYICSLNCLVHVVMYSYYFLSSYKALRGVLKIVKPLITIIQLAQLVIILTHSLVAVHPLCNETKVFYTQVVNCTILIGFFAKFFVDSYSKQSNKAA